MEKKLKYQNWYPPKIHKYGKKLKYQNWYPPKIHKYGAAQKSYWFSGDHHGDLDIESMFLKPNMVVCD